MYKGIDVSSYLDVIGRGKKFYDKAGKEIDPLDEFVREGVNWMRLRVWCNPYSASGESYNAGDCTVAHMIELGTLAAKKGFHIALDLHYSDFWSDPKKQTLPKAWANYSIQEIKNAMTEFTEGTLKAFTDASLKLEMIQVGNEITNGMLWPYGKLQGDIKDGPRTNYGNLIDFIKTGIAACRKVCPNALIMLHLEQSGRQDIYDEWFSQMKAAEVDYDVIGMSYYPFWHGVQTSLWDNVEFCKRKFNKKIVIAETSYAFTMQGYKKKDGTQARLSAGINSPVPLYLPYPATEEGQAQFIKSFLKGARAHGIAGVFYWEPLWLNGEGIKWASLEGLEYIGEGGRLGRAALPPSPENEWANQCLFDYDGRMLDAFKAWGEE